MCIVWQEICKGPPDAELSVWGLRGLMQQTNLFYLHLTYFVHAWYAICISFEYSKKYHPINELLYSYSMTPGRAFFTIPAFAVLSPGKDLSKYEAFSCAEMWSRTLGGI